MRANELQSEFFPANSPVPAGKTPSWFTPLRWFLEQEAALLAERLIPRRFDVDLFGHDEAPVSRLVAKRGGAYFTAATDAFDHLALWAGQVAWIQPPYDSATVDRALQAASAAPMAGRVALVPAWPDRAWWHRHVEPGRRAGDIDVRFLEGRLRFGWPGNPTGAGGDSAMFPSALVVWRPR